jgi:urease accessory protein
MPTNSALLALLQLASPSLPLGAYCYSEGLEYLTLQAIQTAEALEHWLTQDLTYGAIRIEAALMLRGYRHHQDLNQFLAWNTWLTAHKETQELRAQSQQMGKSLLNLLTNLAPHPHLSDLQATLNEPCHYALAFGLGAAHWQIPPEMALQAFLQSWVSNQITAGVKLIPLGQTAGQRILLAMNAVIQAVYPSILALADDQLYSCSLGLGLASMKHEQQYSRLFRS